MNRKMKYTRLTASNERSDSCSSLPVLCRSGDTVGVGAGVCALGGVCGFSGDGIGTVDSPRWIGLAPGLINTDGGIISTVIASVGVPSDGSGNSWCPISSASLAA